MFGWFDNFFSRSGPSYDLGWFDHLTTGKTYLVQSTEQEVDALQTH